MKGQTPVSPVEKIQRGDFADQLDIAGLLLQEMKFPTRRHRDAVDAIMGANGGRPGEFKRTHVWMARRCQYTGNHPETFWRREIEVIEAFRDKTGYQPFRIERGGGIEHEVTTYEDFLTPAVNWLMNAAREAKRAKQFKGYSAAVYGLLPDALKMIPRVPTETEQGEGSLPMDDALYIQRSCNHSLNSFEHALERVSENGGDVDTFAESMFHRYQKRVEDFKRKRQQAGGLTNLSPLEDENPQKVEENPDMLAAALDYARDGKPVFPVRPDKTPYTRNGFKDATTDEATIREWWRKWPDAGIGVPTGEASGWLVIDSDPRHGGDASLCELVEKYGELPPTKETETGGGGHHIVFQYPEGSGIRNSTGKLGEGLDVRAEGGYIVVAPSLHASGRRYRWRNDLPPAPAPDWLLKLLTEDRAASTTLPGSKPRSQATGRAAIGEVIAEGSRNSSLFKIGSSMRGAGAEHGKILAELLDINARRCSPPLPASEVEKIARSAANYAANRVAAGV